MQLSAQYSIGSFAIRWNWLIAACVIITTLALGRLGVWQLDRAAEKVAEQQALLLEQKDNATPIEDIPQGTCTGLTPTCLTGTLLLMVTTKMSAQFC